MSIKKLIAITFVLFVGNIPPAMSEYYVGVDYYVFNTSMKNSAFDTSFSGKQQRVRAGYRGDNVGFELDFLSNQDDTNPSGYLNYKVGPALGAYVYLYKGWIYGKFGTLLTDSTLKSVSSGVSDDHTLWQFSAAVGLQYQIADHVFINADYTYSTGSGSYTDILGSDDPTITSNGYAAGLTFGF